MCSEYQLAVFYELIFSCNFLRGEIMKLFNGPITGAPVKFALATSAEEFYALQKAYVDVDKWDHWEVGGHVGAATHYFEHLVIVCLDINEEDDSIIVHEAVHAFNGLMREVGEHDPSEELNAYGIQYIFKTLRDELWARKIKQAKKEIVKNQSNIEN